MVLRLPGPEGFAKEFFRDTTHVASTGAAFRLIRAAGTFRAANGAARLKHSLHGEQSSLRGFDRFGSVFHCQTAPR